MKLFITFILLLISVVFLTEIGRYTSTPHVVHELSLVVVGVYLVVAFLLAAKMLRYGFRTFSFR
jgi:hypothetical protein